MEFLTFWSEARTLKLKCYYIYVTVFFLMEEEHCDEVSNDDVAFSDSEPE